MQGRSGGYGKFQSTCKLKVKAIFRPSLVGPGEAKVGSERDVHDLPAFLLCVHPSAPPFSMRPVIFCPDYFRSSGIYRLLHNLFSFRLPPAQSFQLPPSSRILECLPIHPSPEHQILPPFLLHPIRIFLTACYSVDHTT